jgi:neutral ceramidase
MTTSAHRALAGTALAAVIGACSSSSDRDPSPPPAPPRDPAHCSFEEPPARAPRPAAAPSAVRAGLGAAVLPVPIGAPLGGYGARVPVLGGEAVDARPARFATGMVPSVGIHDAQRAEALALEAGGEVAVVVRMDAPLLNEASLFERAAAAAPDGSLRGRILLSASHSRPGWACGSRAWCSARRRHAEALARRGRGRGAAREGRAAALEPARIGIAVTPFDRNTVNRDQRGDNDALLGPDGNTAGKGKDPVVWALRVDREDGTPMAALVDLPLHGTVSTERNMLASTDVPGAVERALSAELGYPVIHLQGAAGDISPAGSDGRAACPDDFRCLDFPRLEVVGARAAALISPLVQGIETGGTAAIEIVTAFYTGTAQCRADGTMRCHRRSRVRPTGSYSMNKMRSRTDR